MTCYRSKESLCHNYIQNQCRILGSCLQYKCLLFKRGVGQPVFATCQLEQQRWWQLLLTAGMSSSCGRSHSPPFWAVHPCETACAALQVPNLAIWVPLRFYFSVVSLTWVSHWKPFSALLEMCSQKSRCPQQSPGHLWPMQKPPVWPEVDGRWRQKHSPRGQLLLSWEGCLR